MVVLLDALGTLVALEPPAPRLRRLLADEGYEVSEEQAAAGFAAEIGYYLEHHLEGRDNRSLDDLRDFHRRVLADGHQIERVVNHGSAIGCYFKDPEGNTTEVFWRSPRDCWVPTGDPIDLSQPDDVILGQVNAAADRSKDVPVGGVREPVAAPSGS